MKNTALTLLTGLALATAAQAGSDYSSKGKEVIPPPAPSCLWTWFAGGSGGYVSGDWDEEIYTLHLGAERKCPGSDCSHAFYLEVGYTEKDGEIGIATAPGGPASLVYDVEVEIIPITLNYKYECALTGNLNWYVGAGAGIALYDADASHVQAPGQSFDDTLFYAHVFTGLVYNVSESFEIFGGVRYIFMDDPDLDIGAFGFASGEDEFSMDGDLHFELGARFNF
ncbi:hypothetical protein NT6N_29020 [Oceaniferula spumae]|uniref:Outer membrane protein beta-barrel domain-containing protein n=1 Tax=Oceaniferula spumae TaxID=2979115 RepID=A0AAT9FPP0_9BACT